MLLIPYESEGQATQESEENMPFQTTLRNLAETKMTFLRAITDVEILLFEADFSIWRIDSSIKYSY